MASVHRAAFSRLTAITSAATTPKLSKPRLSNSNSTSLPPKKLSKRKNYLRPKILKTLKKPLSVDPLVLNIPSPESDAVFAPPNDQPVEIFPVSDHVKEIQVLETEGVVGECNGTFGEFSSKSLFKVALGLFGVFILQTICAVWLLGNKDLDGKKENLEEKNKELNGLDEGLSEINEGNISVNENLFLMDKSTFKDKIYEIRAMAREARKTEEKKLTNSEDGGDFDGVNSETRIGIGREIDARLVKVEKKLNSRRGKLPGSYRNVLDEFEDIEAAKEVDNTLMFKKKFKFRSPSASIRSDAMGFAGSENRGRHKNEKSGFSRANDEVMESISGRMEVEKSRSESLIPNSIYPQNDAQNVEKIRTDLGVGDTDKRFVTFDEPSQGRSSAEVMKSRESRDPDMQNLQHLRKESHETTLKSEKYAHLGRNGGSSANVVRDDQSDIKSDMWWLNLPYVLAILMHRGPDHEGAGGLFTLRITSQAQNQSEISYTVAFEDRSDANNFCYLLESFFAELGDFSADIVPLFVKELLEEVKSGTKKMIVVKKRQLKLYVGQPLADVEKALLSLVDHN